MKESTVSGGMWGVVFGAGASVLLMLGACGQKGPLYLPDEGGEVVTRPAGQTQTQSPETAPQPSTQTPADTSTPPEDEEKSPTPR